MLILRIDLGVSSGSFVIHLNLPLGYIVSLRMRMSLCTFGCSVFVPSAFACSPNISAIMLSSFSMSSIGSYSISSEKTVVPNSKVHRIVSCSSGVSPSERMKSCICSLALSESVLYSPSFVISKLFASLTRGSYRPVYTNSLGSSTGHLDHTLVISSVWYGDSRFQTFDWPLLSIYRRLSKNPPFERFVR